jgi:hypothetical protein
MLKSIDLNEAEKVSSYSGADRYCKNPFWLAFDGFTEDQDGELLVYERDELFRNDFPFMKIPTKEQNMENSLITSVSESELEEIKKKGFEIIKSNCFGDEFYYRTSDFLNLDGGEGRAVRKAINQFKKNYKYKLLTDYPKEKVTEFIKTWASKQAKNFLFDIGEQFAVFCVENKEKLKKSRWLFIEIDGKLVGYCLSYKLKEDLWCGIHQKVDYSYKGIGRFLLFERASLFKDVKEFTLGTGAHDEGIVAFKEALHPCRKEKRFFIVVGTKK